MSPALTRRITLGAWLGLLILLLAWHAWLFPSRYFSTLQVLLVTVLPLFLPLAGLLRGRYRAYLGTALLMLLYFMHGIVEAVANPPQRPLALLEVALSLAGCVAASFHARWRLVGRVE